MKLLDDLPTKEEAIKYCEENHYLIDYDNTTDKKVVYWDRSMIKRVLPVSQNEIEGVCEQCGVYCNNRMAWSNRLEKAIKNHLIYYNNMLICKVCKDKYEKGEL